MNYSIYDLTTGKIISSGSCPAEDFANQAQEGYGLIEGGDWSTHKVVDGELVPLGEPFDNGFSSFFRQ